MAIISDREPILEVKQICKIFRSHGRPDTAALQDVSFQLRKGEILGIVGESGSGKSTIARAVTRLMDVTSGEIRLNGQDITHVSGRELREIYRHIQMVFQTPQGSFDPRRTIGDGIIAGLRNQKRPGMNREKAVEMGKALLEQCGIPGEYMQRYPHEISGGQCQRAAIARALITEPDILVCDEATSALDVTIQKQVMTLLASLQETRGMSYIFICHNLALAQSFCDRLLVMQNGCIVEEGTADEVIMHPRAAYTQSLIDAVLL